MVATPAEAGAANHCKACLNEPGFYEFGTYDTGLENLLLVQPAEMPGAVRRFLQVETLTLTPFDSSLVDPAELSNEERVWLDACHAIE